MWMLLKTWSVRNRLVTASIWAEYVSPMPLSSRTARSKEPQQIWRGAGSSRASPGFLEIGRGCTRRCERFASDAYVLAGAKGSRHQYDSHVR